MNNFTIYLSRPITGCSGKEIFDYYESLSKYFSNIGYNVLHPLIAKGSLKNENICRGTGYYDHPMSNDHSILRRDTWMCTMCDIILVDLSNTIKVSIGCISELIMCYLLGKHSVLVMEKSNIHTHAFVLEGADIRVYNLNEAKEYLAKLITVKT